MRARIGMALGPYWGSIVDVIDVIAVISTLGAIGGLPPLLKALARFARVAVSRLRGLHSPSRALSVSRHVQ
jgi:hypothetical protein